MRSNIQFFSTVPYIFCGNIRTDMHTIFTNNKSPFFKLALPLEVAENDRSDFSQFLIKKFRQAKCVISKETILRILEPCKDNPGDTQQLCWGITEVANTKETVNEDTPMSAMRHIFSTERKGHELTLAKLTPIQVHQSTFCPMACTHELLTTLCLPHCATKPITTFKLVRACSPRKEVNLCR